MYSWHQQQWQQLMQRKETLPHAMLLRGRSGIGKHAFAMHLSKALLCRQPDTSHQACGQCASCNWFEEGAHPDFKLVTTEEETNESDVKKKTSKKSQISVAQIRQLYDYLSLSTHQVEGKRIILISPAEALNMASANALLKMLEEPPQDTLFLLVASQPQQLLPTIISRCQALDLPMPLKADAISWLAAQRIDDAETALEYAGGAPLAVMRMQAQLESQQALIKQLSLGAKLDPFTTANIFLAAGMEQAIEMLQKWVYDLINLKLISKLHYHSKYAGAMQALGKSVNLSLVLQFQRDLIEAKRAANHPLSNEMQLENLLLQYTHLFKSKS